MFFFVMLVSASISVSVLVMVCSPVMKSNAEQQLVELSMAMDQLEEKGGFTVDVSLLVGDTTLLTLYDNAPFPERAILEAVSVSRTPFTGKHDFP